MLSQVACSSYCNRHAQHSNKCLPIDGPLKAKLIKLFLEEDLSSRFLCHADIGSRTHDQALVLDKSYGAGLLVFIVFFSP